MPVTRVPERYSLTRPSVVKCGALLLATSRTAGVVARIGMDAHAGRIAQGAPSGYVAVFTR